MDLIKQLAEELSLRPTQVEAAVKLLDEGNTVPFIARYRKEATGSLDDNALRDLEDRLNYLRNLDKRRGEIRSSIEEQGALTGELDAAIGAAGTLAALEDLYMPYKKKRATRALKAKEKGLEPLALRFLEQTGAALPEALAAPFVDPEKGVSTAEEAIAGASDIIAERISDDAAGAWAAARMAAPHRVIRSTSDQTEPGVYSMYYDFAEAVCKIAGYRVLALDRGEPGRHPEGFGGVRRRSGAGRNRKAGAQTGLFPIDSDSESGGGRQLGRGCSFPRWRGSCVPLSRRTRPNRPSRFLL